MAATLFVGHPSLVAAATSDARATVGDFVARGTVLGRSLDLSADGQWLAYETDGRLYAKSVRNPSLTVKLGQGILPRWAPSQATLVFYSSREDGLQIWRWSPGTSPPRRLTSFKGGIDPDPSTRVAGPISDAFRISWSPDSLHVVFASRIATVADAPDPLSPRVLTTTTAPGMTLAGVFRAPASGTDTLQSLDGRTITRRLRGSGERLHNQLFRLDVLTGEVRHLTTTDHSYFHPEWSPDGSSVAAVRFLTNGQTDFSSEAVAKRTDTQVVRINLATKTEIPLSGVGGIFSQLRWSSDGRRVWYLHAASLLEPPTLRSTGDDAAKMHIPPGGRILRFELTGGSPPRLIVHTSGDGLRVVQPLDGLVRPLIGAKELPAAGAWSANRAGDIAWIATTRVVLRMRAGSSDTTFTLESPLPGRKLGVRERFSWRTSNGETREGHLLLPFQLVEGRRYPVIVDTYPLAEDDWLSPWSSNELLAAHDFIVFRPSPRAPHAVGSQIPPSFGPERPRSALWEIAADDILSGLDALARDPRVDASRTCLYGFSNGGSVAIELLSREDRFSCGVIIAPALADWIRPELLETRSSMQMFAGVPLDGHVEEYVRLSPIFRASRIRAPTLIFAGDNDGNFLLDAIELYNVLRRAGRDVTLVRYPGEGHLFSSTVLEDFLCRQLTFFDLFLGNSPPADRATRSSDLLHHHDGGCPNPPRPHRSEGEHEGTPSVAHLTG